MDYIFKEVQIYIKLLLISSKAEANYIITYVLISTERIKVAVNKHLRLLNLRKILTLNLRTTGSKMVQTAYAC